MRFKIYSITDTGSAVQFELVAACTAESMINAIIERLTTLSPAHTHITVEESKGIVRIDRKNKIKVEDARL